MAEDNRSLDNLISQVLENPGFRGRLQAAVRETVVSPDIDLSTPTSSCRPTASSHIFRTTCTSSSVRPPLGNVQDELRRLFPSIRPHTQALSAPNTLASTNITRRSGRKRKMKSKMLLSFTRDVILLNSPHCTKALTGKKKAQTYQAGFAMTAARFEKEWSMLLIFRHIREIFSDKLPDNVDFDLLLPMSGQLVKPTLPEGEECDGTWFCKAFSQKPIYVRPKSNIPHSVLSKNIGISTLNDNGSSCEDETFVHLSDSLEDVRTDSSLPDDPFTDGPAHSPRFPAQVSSEEQFELDTLVAIGNSINTGNTIDADVVVISPVTEESDLTLDIILKGMKEKINDEKTSMFNVDRNDVLQSCLRAMKRKSFCPLNRVSVVFSDSCGTSEGAVDLGGPKREMWRLLLKEVKSSCAFEGKDDAKHLTLNNEALKNKLYFHAGQIMCMSLVHGGQAPQFISETLFHRVIGQTDSVQLGVDDIFDEEIRSEVAAVDAAVDIDELQIALNKSSTYLTLCGCPSYVTNFEKKKSIVNDAVHFYLFDRTRSAFEQFEEGLQTFDFLYLMRKYASLFKDAFCMSDNILSATLLKDLFTICFSEDGTNRRTVENRVVAYWRDYVQDCEG